MALAITPTPEENLLLDDPPNSVDARNHQTAELNALNAALAVIKWKKIKGDFADYTLERECLYVIDENVIENRFSDDNSP